MSADVVKPDNYVAPPQGIKEVFGDPFAWEQPEGWLA